MRQVANMRWREIIIFNSNCIGWDRASSLGSLFLYHEFAAVSLTCIAGSQQQDDGEQRREIQDWIWKSDAVNEPQEEEDSHREILM
jgi:hypothetical protein